MIEPPAGAASGPPPSYHLISHRGWRGVAVPECDAAAVLELMTTIGERLRAGGATAIKHRQGRTAAVVALPLTTGPLPAYVKETRLGLWSPRAWLQANLRASRPRVTWERTLQARAAGVAVQPPLALLEERRWGLIRRAVYVGRYAPAAVSLSEALAAGRPAVPDAVGLFSALAREVRLLHDRGFIHGDLKAGNVLVERERECWRIILIDLEGMTARPQPSIEQRAVDLGRLWLALLPLTAPVDRERLLDAYAAEAPRLDVAALRRVIDQRVTALQTKRFDELGELGRRLMATGRAGERRWLVLAPKSAQAALQATPLLAAWRRAMPALQLELLASVEAAPVLAGNSDAAAVTTTPGLLSGVALLVRRRGRYDGVIDLTASWSSALLTWLTGAPVRIGYRTAAFSSKIADTIGCYTHGVAARPEQRDPVRHYLWLGAALGLEAASPQLIYRVTPQERREMEEELAGQGLSAPEAIIVIDLSAQHGSARWPADAAARYCALLDRLGVRIVLIGSPADRSEAEALQAATARRPIVLIGLSFRRRAALLSRAALAVSANPETIECAAAVNCPALHLRGGVDAWRPVPQRPALISLRAYCLCQERSADWRGCVGGPDWCMRSLTPERLFEATERLYTTGPAVERPAQS